MSMVEELKKRFNLNEYLPEDVKLLPVKSIFWSDLIWTIVQRETIDLRDNLVLMQSELGYVEWSLECSRFGTRVHLHDEPRSNDNRRRWGRFVSDAAI